MIKRAFGKAALPPIERSALLLEVAGLRVDFGPVRALDGVSFEVAQGSTTAVVGPAAAGKTVLFHAILGLVRPSAGSIRFRGRELVGLSSRRIAEQGIALVPEGRRLFPSMSVRENLELGAALPRARPGRAARLERVLALFPRLAERIDEDAGLLSAGDQQMAAIGRGLMAKPMLMLFDAPSRGLGDRLTRRLFQLIGTLEAEGVTILVAERPIAPALRLADSAHLIGCGRVLCSAPGLELLAALESDETEADPAADGTATA